MWKNCAFRIAHKFCFRWDLKRNGKRHLSKTLLPGNNCIFGFFFSSILSRFSLLFLIVIICLKGSVNTKHPILTVLHMKSIKYHSTMIRFLTLVLWVFYFFGPSRKQDLIRKRKRLFVIDWTIPKYLRIIQRH